jgi:ribonuclease HI
VSKIVEPDSYKVAINDKRGIVLHCDGSSNPNPGRIGSGTHGYLYEIKELKKPIIVDNNVITDMGYILTHKLGNNTPVDVIEYYDFVQSYMEDGTNNKAEIMAMYNALEYFKDKEDIERIYIKSDSEYLINCVTKWCPLWARNNWVKNDNTPVSNKEILKKLHNLLIYIKDRGIKVEIDWIKAHVGLYGNIHADYLAAIGSNLSRDNVVRHDYNISTPKDYWNSSIDKHPFINFKRIYFNSVKKYNDPGCYYQADPGVNDFIIGKRVAESGYSIIRLNEPNEYIEIVKDRQFHLSKDINSILFIKLEKLFHKSVSKYIDLFKGYCLNMNRNNLNLNYTDRDPVTIELNPTGLSLRAIEFFNFLESMLDRADYFKKNNEYKDAVVLNLHDITSYFFKQEEKKIKKDMVLKTVLDESITNNLDFINITVKEKYLEEDRDIIIPLVFSLDILQRNNLKKLEDLNPSIHIVTWKECPESIRYAVMIECDTGLGIWSNYFCDKIFLNLKKKKK